MKENRNDPDAVIAEIRRQVAERLGRELSGGSAAIGRAPTSLVDLHDLLGQADRVAQIGTIPPAFVQLPRPLRPIARLVTRGVFFLLQVVSVDQRVFNSLSINALRVLGDHLAQLGDRIDSLDGEMRGLQQDVQEQARRIEQRLEQIEQRAIDLQRGQAQLERELQRGPQLVGPPAAQDAPSPSRVPDALYVALEDRFRGSRADIRQRQLPYLTHVRSADAGTVDRPVLDLGSGRGEWLELLRDEGLVARGVDLNETLVEECRAAGLDVRRANALVYLAGLAPESLGAITAFHLVEHLSFEDVVGLLDEAARALAPGGLLVLETPNPANLQVGAHTFYTDPTHRNPIPSALLRFLAEARGFAEVEILDLHPYPESARLADGEIAVRLNQLLFGPQDYALIARRP